MFFFFVCGEHTFRSDVKGYEGLTVQCFNCGNMTAHVVKERPFFTICYVVRNFPSFSPLLQSVSRLTVMLPARHPAHPLGLRRCCLQHLQLPPAAREPKRRACNGQRRPGRTKPGTGATEPGTVAIAANAGRLAGASAGTARTAKLSDAAATTAAGLLPAAKVDRGENVTKKKMTTR